MNEMGTKNQYVCFEYRKRPTQHNRCESISKVKGHDKHTPLTLLTFHTGTTS